MSVAAPVDTDTGLSFTVSLICYQEENAGVDTGFKTLHFFTVKWQKIYLTGRRSLIVFGSQGDKRFSTWRTTEGRTDWTLGKGLILLAPCQEHSSDHQWLYCSDIQLFLWIHSCSQCGGWLVLNIQKVCHCALWQDTSPTYGYTSHPRMAVSGSLVVRGAARLLSVCLRRTAVATRAAHQREWRAGSMKSTLKCKKAQYKAIITISYHDYFGVVYGRNRGRDLCDRFVLVTFFQKQCAPSQELVARQTSETGNTLIGDSVVLPQCEAKVSGWVDVEVTVGRQGFKRNSRRSFLNVAVQDDYWQSYGFSLAHWLKGIAMIRSW